eukprot:TRINITY_DN2152_c0_g3_i1.p1 TRINITY_DN2152_c0_g3~~TRINITY_DN2152_c0_g3_i1.p1  ORF type:complete len:262 (-),score=69.35 TRINITY_DN2152_c0_g3_i1:43-720(-)
MEKLEVDKKIFHKVGCFKCETCKKTLGAGNYAALEGKYFCKPHFKQLFALKGNYSESFGSPDPKKKWTPQTGTFKGVEQAKTNSAEATPPQERRSTSHAEPTSTTAEAKGEEKDDQEKNIETKHEEHVEQKHEAEKHVEPKQDVDHKHEEQVEHKHEAHVEHKHEDHAEHKHEEHHADVKHEEHGVEKHEEHAEEKHDQEAEKHVEPSETHNTSESHDSEQHTGH